MKKIYLLFYLLMLSIVVFPQSEELSSEEKNKIIEEIKRCTEDFKFINNTKECISLMNLSFNSNRINYNNAPWCNTYIAALSTIETSSENIIYFNIYWESKDITPLCTDKSKICGIFCYKIITNMGCVYCGRNAIAAGFVKKNGEWIVGSIDNLTLLKLNNTADNTL